MIFHPLDTSIQPPVRLNNPFYYEPDALCRLAIAQVAAYLRGDNEQIFAKGAVDTIFQAEIAKGKMFGVVIVRQDGELGYIAGYSGQVVGRSDWPDFVPQSMTIFSPMAISRRTRLGSRLSMSAFATWSRDRICVMPIGGWKP